MAGGYHRAEAQTARVSRRDSRRWMDETLIGGVTGTHDSVLEVEGSRLLWWRTRRRLHRKYGIVATRVSATEWRLRREV
jgi:hypothetical protein